MNLIYYLLEKSVSSFLQVYGGIKLFFGLQFQPRSRPNPFFLQFLLVFFCFFFLIPLLSPYGVQTEPFFCLPFPFFSFLLFFFSFYFFEGHAMQQSKVTIHDQNQLILKGFARVRTVITVLNTLYFLFHSHLGKEIRPPHY